MGIARSGKAAMRPNTSRFFAFRLRSRHLSRKSSPPFADVDQRQHRIGTVGVLRQAAIAYFHKPPHPLEGQKRMFDFRPHSRFSAVGLPIAWAQRAVPVRTLVGEVLGARGNPLELLALVFSPISAVAIQPALFTMQQIGQLLAVVHIGRSHARTVHQRALAIYADVDLHAEVPLIAFLRFAASPSRALASRSWSKTARRSAWHRQSSRPTASCPAPRATHPPC